MNVNVTGYRSRVHIQRIRTHIRIYFNYPEFTE